MRPLLSVAAAGLHSLVESCLELRSQVSDLEFIAICFGLVAIADVFNFLMWCRFPPVVGLSRKLHMWIRGWQHMLFSNDGRWKPLKVAPDPGGTNWNNSEMRRIIFIRHGESSWNKVFNRTKNPITVLRYLFVTLVVELLSLFRLDSRFYDSPLSDRGMQEADDLRKRLADPKDDDCLDLKTLRGDGSPSVVVSSQLRRAIVTGVVGLWPRLRKSSEQVHLLSDLQEGSFNVDCVPISSAGEVPNMPNLWQALKGNGLTDHKLKQLFATGLNLGDKPVRWADKKKGYNRVERFADWCFEGLHGNTIIVVGHSIWFRNFFKCFLPHDSSHKAKEKKMQNVAAVAFNLYHVTTDDWATCCWIDEASIVEVHRGFME